jgi:hypothetical protein
MDGWVFAELGRCDFVAEEEETVGGIPESGKDGWR